MEEEFIQSRQNPRVKLLSKLRDRSGRRKLGLFVVEGLRELSRCVEAVGVEEIYFCPEFFKSTEHSQFIDEVRKDGKIPLCRLSEGAFEKVSNREGCDGLLGVAKQWGCLLSDIDLSSTENPTILVADSIEKPGNLGALIRSADSLGAVAVILTNSVSDIFNPAVVARCSVFGTDCTCDSSRNIAVVERTWYKNFWSTLGCVRFPLGCGYVEALCNCRWKRKRRTRCRLGFTPRLQSKNSNERTFR